jgi:hypothetical protein
MRASAVLIGSLGSLVLLAAPANAQGSSTRIAIGYAFAAYLESGGSTAPLGAFVSFASTRKVGIEGDVAYHRDPQLGGSVNTVIVGVGPRFAVGTGTMQPFLHVLGGLRYDSGFGTSNTAFGGSAGGGVDIPAGSSLLVRLGADFQIFFDEGTNLKTLRLAAGIAF